MNLDEVFERVLKTEQTAERRHDQLIQVQKEIKSKQAEIANVQKATERLQETIRTRDLVALHESKWESELASARLTSLINQHEVVTNRVSDLENQLAEKTLNREKQINGFLNEVQIFAENCDLVDGKAKRKQIMADELEHLKHEEEELLKDLDSELEEKKVENEKKKAELASSDNAQLQDPEYIRLQEELESLDCDAEQKNIALLRMELVNLQREKRLINLSKDHSNPAEKTACSSNNKSYTFRLRDDRRF
ncbi:uncharacterized protein LOC108950100 [Ciona intestinalis]